MNIGYLFAAVFLAVAALVIANEVTNKGIDSPPIDSSIECQADSDCMPAGCSGQVCSPKNKASEIITTCEYSPEYACLRTSASCSCISNKCNWNYAPNYAQCVAQSRVQYGTQRIS